MGVEDERRRAWEALQEQREVLRQSLSEKLHASMEQLLGERVDIQLNSSNQELLPGLEKDSLNEELLTDIRQFLALLHEDGSWQDRKRQEIEVGHFLRDSVFGQEDPGWGARAEFSGNDKYGLTLGLGEVTLSRLSMEQIVREEAQLDETWYVTLYGVYVQSRPEKMEDIAKKIAQAGLPLDPWIQIWLKDRLKEQETT